jgi:3-oxoacyl-[acyl-carrier protein] reductase
MDLALSGKTALITAAGRGIGRACAAALAAEGVRVAIAARTTGDLNRVIEEMGGAAGGHIGFTCDLTAVDAPAKLARDVLDGLGRVDILVHNLGGTLGVRDYLAPIADWRRVWRLNLEVAIELNELLVPPMIARRSGRVITISSLAGLENQGALAYGVAKAALTAYSKGLGRELAPTGVVASAVVPGTIMTEDGVWARRLRTDSAAVQKYIADCLPAGRFQDAQSVASLVTFLAAPISSAFNGAIIPIDAGQGKAFTTM